MRLKHIKGSEELVKNSNYVINNPFDYIGKWKSVFNNKNKIHIEIGMGKGNFLISLARKNPNINYIGIEKYASVLINALKVIEEEKLENIKIIVMDANNIDKVFNKEISKIYLNFSDPWPKKRHEKRRLTSSMFLNKYDKLFKNIKLIEQKTDNDDLFNYSLESFKAHKYIVLKKSTNFIADIKTEYECKFINKGKNINYVKVFKL